MNTFSFIIIFLAALCAFSGGPRRAEAGLLAPAPTLPHVVAAAYPHDPAAFTQGLVFDKGRFYESNGLYGRSRLTRAELETGRVEMRRALPPNVFGEGLALVGDRLRQLTWKAHKVYTYDKNTFELVEETFFPTQGWGLAHDGERFLATDGSAVLYFYDDRFRELGRTTVTDAGRPVANLNELEWVEGKLLANVWMTDRIAVIAPQDGVVRAWIDLAPLRKSLGVLPGDAVLNGIAYDAEKKRLFVTGKLWPKVFEIEVEGLF